MCWVVVYVGVVWRGGVESDGGGGGGGGQEGDRVFFVEGSEGQENN